jgi:hypothetical protein
VAIIIDFSSGETSGELTLKKQIGAKPPESDAPLEKDAKPEWEQCKHGRALISTEKREVTCKDCGAQVDPIAYILLLYGHYQRRIDNRLAKIREFEKRQKDAEIRKKARKQQPRQHRIARRADTAERAAYNEYQAKVLAARAERQRAIVARLDEEIRADELPDAADAVARSVDDSTN